MKEYNIEVPLLNTDILSQFKIKDKIYLTGEIFVFRDQVHKKIANSEFDQISEINFYNSAIYYCAATPPKEGFVIGSCGPTSSYRMDEYTENVLKLGVKIMVGKGYRSQEIVFLCKKYKSVYCITYGGCGAFLNKFVEDAEIVGYPQLSTEALYKFKVKNFPCIVAIDIYGEKIWR
ncbi:MAG: fumarate hydratase C-terminal domain-containing protein [Endomicrobiia bacterium]